MAANIGRELKVKQGSTVFAGVRTKSVSVNGEPIDITTDDDEGYRTLLAEAGQVSLDLSIEGLTTDATLRAAIMTNTTLELTGITLEYPNGDTVTGTFFLNSLEESGEYNNAITFSGSLQSSGKWTYTAAA